MDKIESFKYIRPITSTASESTSVGERLPIGISWISKGRVYNRINENGGLCAVLLDCYNAIGVVENPYAGGFNSAYVLDGTNQTVWNVSELFITAYGNKYHDGVRIHFADVRIEKEMLCFFVNISNCDFRFSFNIRTGELGRLIETR